MEKSQLLKTYPNGITPKISFIKARDKDGTSYNQRIKITPLTFELIKKEVLKEIEQGYPNKNLYVNTSLGEYYLKPLKEFDRQVFMNHTTTRFINLILQLNLRDRNTYLQISYLW